MLDKNRLNAIAQDVAKNVDIVDIIGNYIDLQRKGKGFWGICPFHDDKHPSLSVSQEKQIFTCFSCHATGGVFKFVMDYEKISFTESIKKVCELANIPVPSELANNMPVYVNKYQHLNDLMNDLAKYYMLQLQTEDGMEAKKYLDSRNITNEDIQTFKIGYSPIDGKKVIDFLRSKGYTDDEIISVGVGVDNQNKDLIDRLRGRVVFSLTDPKGNVIGFSGRRIVDDETAKYVNSPETVLFHKSNTLYNYKNAFDNAKNGYTYIVEGFMDAIALHKAGLKSVVATMGTAFTEDHIRLLKNLKSEIRLLFDADAPGQEATARSLKLLYNSKLNIQIVRPLEGYKDIDEMLNKAGKEEVIKAANLLKSPLEWQLDHLASTTDFSNHESVKKYVDSGIEFIVDASLDELDREYYFNQISSKSKVSTQLLNKLYKQKSDKVDDVYKEDIFENHSYQEVQKNLNKYEQASHQILLMMINNPMNIVKYNSLGISLCDKTCRQIAALIVDTYSKGLDITYANLMLEASVDMAKLLGQLANEEYPENKLEDLAKILKDDMNSENALADLQQQLEQETDFEKQKEIALKIINLKRGK